jgi:hypothetical protein
MEGLENPTRLGVNDKRHLFQMLLAMSERLLYLNKFPVDKPRRMRSGYYVISTTLLSLGQIRLTFDTLAMMRSCCICIPTLLFGTGMTNRCS